MAASSYIHFAALRLELFRQGWFQVMIHGELLQS